MDKNGFLLIIVILLLGIVVSYSMKKKVLPGVKPQEWMQNWNQWDKQEGLPEPVQPNDELPDEEEQQEPDSQPDSTNPQSYEEALQLAKNSEKKIFLYFSADWCANCGEMKQTFDDPSVAKMLAEYIKYEVDVDKEREVARKYKVHGVPAYRIIDGSEVTLNHGVGKKNPRQFLSWINRSSF